MLVKLVLVTVSALRVGLLSSCGESSASLSDKIEKGLVVSMDER